MAYVSNQDALLSELPDNLPPCRPPHSSSFRPSWWQRQYSSELTNHNAEGPLPDTADIIIIGSGITGSHVAAELVNKLHRGNSAESATQTSIVVLEAREFCSGATSRNGGHLTALPRTQYANIANRYGQQEAKRAVRLEDRACEIVLDTARKEGWTERIDLVTGGNVHLFGDAQEAQEVRRQVDAAAADGVDVSMLEWLTREQIQQKYGAQAHSGLLMPGSNLFPLKYVTLLFEKALNDSARPSASSSPSPVSLNLFTHTVVNSVKSIPSSRGGQQHRWKVHTTRGAILAQTVIHATNGYASSIVPSLASGSDRIVPTRGQVLAYQPAAKANPRWTTAFSSPHGDEYFFQRHNGGPIILGGARLAAGAPFEFGPSDDGVVNECVEAELETYLPKQFPELFGDDQEQPGEKECSWTGLMGYRESGAPLVGKLYVKGRALEGQFICAGFSGHGMARAAACAQVVAHMALAELESEIVQLPSWFPRHFLSGPNHDSCPCSRLCSCSNPVKENGSSTRWWCIIS